MPDDKIPITEFAAKIKAKYPEYASINDTLLVKKMVEKYPEYESQIDLSGIEAIKKKDPSASFISGINSLFGIEAGNFNVQSEEKVTLKHSEPVEETPEQKVAQPDFTQDPVGNILHPYRETAKEDFSKVKSFGTELPTFSNKPAGYGLTPKVLARDDPKYQAQTKLQESTDQLNHVAEGLYNSIFKNGEDAEKYLQETAAKNNGKLPQGNATIGLAINKAQNLEALRKRLTGNNINEVAIDLAREGNSHIDKQISALESAQGIGKGEDYYKNVVPQVMQGRYVDELFHDPDFAILAKQDPNIKAQYDQLKDGGIYKLYPEYGENVARNIISREYEKRKANMIANPIFNHSDYLDKLSDELFKDNPALKEIADTRLKGHWEGKLDTPDVAAEFATGAKKTYEGMGNTLKDIFGGGDSEAERITKGLQDEYGNVSSGVTGWKKNVGTVASFGGMITGMATGGILLKGLGMSTKAINTLVTGDTFYDQELNNWTMKYPGEQWKAKAGALFSTAAYASVAKAFPSTKVADAVAGKLEPEIKETLSKLESGEVNKEATQTLVQKYANILKSTATGTGEATGHMVAVSAFQNALDDAMNLDLEARKQYHPDNELLDVAKNMIIGSVFPQAVISIGNRNAVANSLYSIADNPKRFTDVLNESATRNPDMAADIEKKMEDISFLSDTKKELDARGISPGNQKRFLLEAMNEKYAKEKRSTKTPDSSILKKQEDQVRGFQDIKDRILNGEDIAGDEAKLTIHTPEGEGTPIKETKQKALDELEKAKDKVKAHVGDAVDNDPEASIDYVAQQALNLGEDGKPHNDGREKESFDKATEQFGKPMVDAAVEYYQSKVKEPSELKSTSVILPEENKVAENIPLIKPNETSQQTIKPDEPVTPEKKVPPASTTNENQQPAETGSGEPPQNPPGEIRAEEGEQEFTSLQNAVAEEKRKESGLTPALEEAKRSFGTVWDEAVDKIKNGYDPRLLVETLKKKSRALTDVEDAILLHYQNTKESQLSDVTKKVNEAGEKGDNASLEEAKIQRASVLDDLQDIYDVGKSGGRETARGLNARKMMIDRKYSLVNMMQEKRAANDGKPLTPEQETEVNKDYENIKRTNEALQKRIEELEARVKDLEAKKSIKEKGANLAKKLRGLKSKQDKAQANVFGLAVAAYDGAIETIATLVENGAKLIDAVNETVKDITFNNDQDKEDFKAHLFALEDKNPHYDILDKQAMRLKADHERAIDAYEGKLKKDELKKRSRFSKIQDAFIKWERAFKLSGISTLAKLTSAAITRGVTEPIEEGVGSIYSAILPDTKRGKERGVEGGVNVKALAKGYKESLTNGMRDAAMIMKRGSGGKSDLDVIFGRRGDLPPEAINFFGQLHSALKAPIKRFVFEKSLQRRLARNIKNGVDVSDPMVQTRILMESYKDGQRAIFMQDNFVSNGYRNFVNSLEQSKEYPKLGKAAATFFQWLLPFVKVPTNIVGEIGTNVAGVPIGVGATIYKGFKKGLENLEPQERDFIIRNMKKGTIGIGALLIGYMNPNLFGGYYQEGEKRGNKDLKAGQFKFFGVTLPAWLLESPIFQTMQLGATVRRVKDKTVKGEPQGITEGMWAGALGLAQHEPLIDQPLRMYKVFKSPDERNYYLDELVKSSVIPAGLQNIATWTDDEQRTPHTLKEHVEMGIPGLRQDVPVKHTYSDKELKQEEFKPFIDKGLSLPYSSPQSIEIKDEESGRKEKLSDFPKETIDKYYETQKENLKNELATIQTRDRIYVDKFGDVSLSPKTRNDERKTFDELTKEEMIQILAIAGRQATEKTKKEMFSNR